MNYPATDILNAHILTLREQDLLRDLKEGVLITPNLDHLRLLQSDEELYRCYEEAEWVVCDSRILYFASRLLSQPIPEAIPGSSFFTHFYEYHRDDAACRIFLLGAKEGVAAQAMQRINERIGRQIVVGAHSPSMGFENKPEEIEQILDIIRQSGANVVLVGVGAPKQEKFIHTYRHRLPEVKIWMALGATIDFEAGNIRRAPRWMQRIGMEWFYRMMSEPKRLVRRYAADMVFFYHFARQLMGCYRNPFKK